MNDEAGPQQSGRGRSILEVFRGVSSSWDQPCEQSSFGWWNIGAWRFLFAVMR
jgi:hypothetical protein